MKILAIETATEACSAALLIDDAVIERYELAPQRHNRLILPMIESLLAEAGIKIAQVDALAFGRGPGSFTGVRIAAGVAQGIAFGADLPVVPVSTLAALAQDALTEASETIAFPCIDARMSEVYWGVYRKGEAGLAELLGQESVLPPDRVSFPDQAGGVGIGSGWKTYGSVLEERLGGCVKRLMPDRFPRAAMVARLGADAFGKGLFVQPEQALPVYLRDNVAKKPGGDRRA
ncbi:tRNA (adenosine(37)-N6)-threonylcarbamoyltransferase complex dimerization subunit type 1 TsaB [Methylocaldum szegediense]|jgi:tRNA threonylcarbamoyladenosine biosynthesis protein TsaB|uniref:tRNA threonylcarbamoyladenosine biosynthesis protein TsaB n=1 Tax=Methylocaldum szegediense TaxID=73780 RepID=A0ABM9HZ36_9GAMM|nr:tRNA (adenosine(37)-N6)-threonylcarbamoyltransferase complex dimerization subunit type 1 TsaB [Methylocaldum szegediense]CAI8774778.1 N(6)-L-threonylcarbamoyladenine synthase, TsaB subunit [Methylocaldum szegediense]